jgi:uncharacterized damage-inducible protein DinB
MNHAELKTLLDYHYWARNRILDAAGKLTAEQYNSDLSSSFRSIRETLVHVYSAEFIWCERWSGQAPAGMLLASDYPDIVTLRSEWLKLENKMRTFLDGLGEDGIHRVIVYKTFAGQEFSQVYWQMLQHVVNHASYHRGQITTMIRQLKAAPPQSMDMVTYYREH